MNTQELLHELDQKIKSGELSKAQILQRFSTATPSHTKFSITKLLYILGGVITMLGIFFFVGQIWEDIGSFLRIAITLGLGVILAATGSFLLMSQPKQIVGAVFHILGGFLIPGGVIVTLTELFPPSTETWPLMVIFGGLFAMYLMLTSVHKHAALTFFSVANGTAFLVFIVTTILGDSVNKFDWVFTYLSMIIGVVYIMLGRQFTQTWNSKLTWMLYLCGVNAILIPAFTKAIDSGAWQFIMFALLGGGYALAMHLKSKILLGFSTFFLILHLGLITGEYFANSIGWPIALVILGFIVIGLGYLSVNISKRYIETS